MAKFFDELTFTPTRQELLASRTASKVTVLTGYNNSGKSAYLKSMGNDDKVLYLGPNRFYSFHYMQLFNYDENELNHIRNNMANQRRSQYTNFEGLFYDTNRALTRLSDERRQKLFEVFEELFGVPIAVKAEFAGNVFSNRHVDINGDSLSVTSSGTRLFLGVLAALMDERFNVVALDEPELGLSPMLQAKLAPIIVDRVRDADLFPHNPHFVISTHSHSFLDKLNPTNNFIISRDGNAVSARPCSSKQELIDVQFRMLVNDLGSLFLPDAILFAEGETDKIFLQRIMQITFPDKKIVVESCNGDIAARLNSWSNAVGDLQTGPYRNRTFVIADSVIQSGLERIVARLGIPSQSVARWEGNGIEYLYPVSILSIIFGATILSTSELSIDGDRVTAHEITKTKMELATSVVSHLSNDTPIPDELTTKLLAPLRQAILPDA